MLNIFFPDKLILADLAPFYKNSDSEGKTNYRPIRVLPHYPMSEQLNSFFETKLSPHLCRFRSRDSTQHALSNLFI